MPEGSIIVLFFGLAVAAAGVGAVYCLRLALKYRRIERDMRCIHNGAELDVMEIVYDRDDWFRRRVRLHKDSYPYYEDVPISDVRAVR